MRRRYTLVEVLDRLRFQYDYERERMDCPFCGTHQKMSLDFEESTYRCPKCGNSGGVFHLFAHAYLGYELEKEAERSERIKVAKALAEFMGDGDLPSANIPPRPPKRPRSTTPVAIDDRLDAVYQVFYKIPELRLSDEHREKLHKRGLNDEAIDRNGYLTMPNSMPVSDYYIRLYEEAGGEIRRNHELPWISAKQIRFGLMIAHRVIQQGLNVSGVPGFFTFGKYWAFWVNPGMMIPTRNIKGQIVVWQVRRDQLNKKDQKRYFTNSCGSLPGHTRGSVSRCHFPLGNAPISAETPFLLTEGPLKADVACHLYGAPVAFGAIHGIQNTKDFYQNIPTIQNAGVSKIFNALDMDRLTNPGVRGGAEKIKKTLQKMGMPFPSIFWGTSFAVSMLTAMLLIARHRNISLPPDTSETLFDRLSDVCAAMEKVEFYPTNFYKDENGEGLHWEPETKGIDDYLLNCQ